MSKKTKDNARPVYECPKCRMRWVHDTDPYCIICKILGEPQNKGAAKTLKKLHKQEEDEYLGRSIFKGED